MDATRLAAVVVAVATALGPAAGADPGPPAPAPASVERVAPAVSTWAAGLGGTVTAANRAW